MEASEQDVEYYRSSDGKEPFREWFARIKDWKTQQKLYARIARLRGGNFGDSESIGEGASETKIDYGPGYRIYYGIDGNRLLILLQGGDKSTQSGDIALAKKYWAEYKSRKKKTASKKRANT